MKKSLLLLFTIVTSCYTVERNCTAFHTGTFKFETTLNDTLVKSIYKRTQEFEVETFNGVTDSSSIRWVNDCECILTKLNPTSFQERQPIRIKIIETKDDSYIFEYTLLSNYKVMFRGEATKISD